MITAPVKQNNFRGKPFWRYAYYTVTALPLSFFVKMAVVASFQGDLAYKLCVFHPFKA